MDGLVSLITLIAVVASVVAGVRAARAFATARLLGSTGPTPMSELVDGLHEVRGTSLAEGGLTSAVSGRACMYWRVVVEQQRRTRWETVYDRRGGVPFWVDDGTGRVRVDPTDAEVVVSGAARVRSGVYAQPSPEWEEVVGRLGAPALVPTQPYLRWREEHLDAGDVVTVVGNARRDAGGSWEIVGGGEAFQVSDRDDGEVVRHHRRLGRRWALAAGGALLLLAGMIGQSIAG